MVDAAPHAVMLCNLLRHGLEQWAARGSSPCEAAALIGVLKAGRIVDRQRELQAVTVVLADASELLDAASRKAAEALEVVTTAAWMDEPPVIG